MTQRVAAAGEIKYTQVPKGSTKLLAIARGPSVPEESLFEAVTENMFALKRGPNVVTGVIKSIWERGFSEVAENTRDLFHLLRLFPRGEDAYRAFRRLNNTAMISLQVVANLEQNRPDDTWDFVNLANRLTRRVVHDENLIVDALTGRGEHSAANDPRIPLVEYEALAFVIKSEGIGDLFRRTRKNPLTQQEREENELAIRRYMGLLYDADSPRVQMVMSMLEDGVSDAALVIYRYVLEHRLGLDGLSEAPSQAKRIRKVGAHQ